MNLRHVSLCALIALLIGCQKPDYKVVDLPASPGGKYEAGLKVLQFGSALRIRAMGKPWDEYEWLAIGQCSSANFYWASNDHAVLAYDRIEISYFVDRPTAWGGARLSLCNKSVQQCPPSLTARKPVPNCNEHTM